MGNVFMGIVSSAGMIFSSKDCIWKLLCSFNELIVSWQKKYLFCFQKQNQVLTNDCTAYKYHPMRKLIIILADKGKK